MLAKYDNFLKYTQREVASKLGISQSSLCSLLKNRDNIDAQIVSYRNMNHRQKQAENVEAALLDQFKNVRLKKISISRWILFKKAEKFVQMLGVQNFATTDDWLTRWKK